MSSGHGLLISVFVQQYLNIVKHFFPNINPESGVSHGFRLLVYGHG